MRGSPPLRSSVPWRLAAVLTIAAAVGVADKSGRSAASYCRFSSANQDERSIFGQQEKCRSRAEADGLTISPDFEFRDDAVSGATWSRPGLDQFLAAVREGRVGTVYVESLSRLARDSVLTLQTLQELVHQYEVRVVSIDDGLDTAASDNWEMVAAIFGVQNQHYLKALAKEVTRGQSQIVREGYCVGDTCFGFASRPLADPTRQRKGKNAKPIMEYVIHAENAEWVRRIFAWYVVERRSLSWIARELTRLGAPKDHRATTKNWRPQLVAGVLSQRKYIGEWTWGVRQNYRDPRTKTVRQKLRGPTESDRQTRLRPELAIIDRAVFEQAQNRLAIQRNAQGPRRKRRIGEQVVGGLLSGATSTSSFANPRHLLQGVVVCGECAQTDETGQIRYRPLYTGGKNAAYMQCHGRLDGTCDCRATLNRQRAEQYVLNAVGRILIANPTVVELICSKAAEHWRRRQAARQDSEPAIRRKLADVEQRIANLVNLCEEQGAPELLDRLRELRQERERLDLDLRRPGEGDRKMATPPTAEWVTEKLRTLDATLRGEAPGAAHALRSLLRGSIVVTEHRERNDRGVEKRYLRGRFEICVPSCAVLLGEDQASNPTPDEESRHVVDVDFRAVERHVQLADQIKDSFDAGLPVAEICQRFKISETLYLRAWKHWHASRGLQVPDGRSLRSRLERQRQADVRREEIMFLWRQDLAYGEIAARLDIGIEVVRQAVVADHEQRGEPVPDGRRRRKDIRLRRTGEWQKDDNLDTT
ncbi:MAG: recombinase family protein [Pirellulales bacterium]|nr:recombinase family protein [Pirellulales bacterium]